VKTANPIMGELTAPPSDSWRMIFVDAVVCTVLFALATTVSVIFMHFVESFVNTRLAIVYLPVWSSCMLSVAFYARGRRRLLFGIADLAWAIGASSLSFGAHGFGFSLYAVVCSWFIISRMDFKILWPLNRIKPTSVECLVVLAICGVLHGLALPAITTNCVGRRQSIAPITTTAPPTQPSGTVTTTTTNEAQ